MYYGLINSMNRGVGYTARTTAFATATGITDVTILGALNTFDLGLISNSLDSKMKAVYPFLGGTSTTHKFNFMNAVDSDAAFRLQFNGGWTHSSTGALPNGTNAYANTFYNATSLGDSAATAHLSYYSRTNNTNIGIDIGAQDSTSGVKYNFISLRDSQVWHSVNEIGWGAYTNANSSGFYNSNRINTGYRSLLKNGTLLGGAIVANNGTINANIFIGALNVAPSSVSNYSTKQCAFASIGIGLTNSEATIFYNLVQAMQTTLARNV